MSILEELAVEFGASVSEIARLMVTAPRRYKSYEISKKAGGTRTIAQPARELKVIQRYIAEKKLSDFPIHEIAAAYVRGRGIADNAAKHVRSNFILKLDFKKFFNSIVPRDLERVNRRVKPSLIPLQDLESYYHFLFWGNGEMEPKALSIGAPSSPILSNIIMYNLDCEIADIAHALDVVVTRYADDITASARSRGSLEKFERRVRRAVAASTSPRLEFNEQKTGLYSRGDRRLVTGIILTPDGKISIGRERKRKISSLIHRISLGSGSEAEIMLAKGMLGFVISVEPHFVNSMRSKYGNKIVNQILAADFKRSSSLD